METLKCNTHSALYIFPTGRNRFAEIVQVETNTFCDVEQASSQAVFPPKLAQSVAEDTSLLKDNPLKRVQKLRSVFEGGHSDGKSSGWSCD